MKKILSFIICAMMILIPTISSFAESDIAVPELQTPVLSVKQLTVPTSTAGSSSENVSFEIINNSFSIAYNVSLSVSPDSGLTVAADSYTLDIGAIAPFGSVKVELPYGVSYTAADGLHEINLTISCKSGDLFNMQNHSFSGSVKVLVEAMAKIIPPTISNISFDKKTVVAGETNFLTFTVSNPNTTDLTNLTFDIDGTVTGQTEVSNISPVSLLKAGSSVKITAEFSTYTQTPEDLYDFMLTVSATDATSTVQTVSKGIYFTVTASSEFTEYSPRVIVDNYTLSPSSVQPGNTATLKINLSNLGVLSAENVKVSLGGYDGTQITLREVTASKEVGTIDKDMKVSVEYSLSLSKVFPQDTQVPLVLTLTYTDAIGNFYTDEANITLISVSPKAEDNKSDEPVYKTPKIIIESFSTEKDSINAGEEFNLTFILKNTSEDFAVENITLLLQNDTNNIFTPVSASYSYFIEKIPAGGTYEMSIPLLPKISADSNIYAISFAIDYEYLSKSNGNSAYISNSVKETLSVKVVQPINIELSNVYVPETVYEGDSFYISFNYNNKSRSNLYFLNIDLEGDFAFTDGKQEMGSIPSGYSDSFDSMVQCNASAGEYTFDIVFNFKDALNKESQYRYPCTVKVEPAPVYDDTMFGDDYPSADDTFIIGDDYNSGSDDNTDILPFMSNVTFFVIIGIVVAAAAVTITVIIIKKNKKVSEDGADE